MIEWISKQHREKKRKQAHEEALKTALAKKLEAYESHQRTAHSDYTEIVIDGKLLRVAKESITISDVLTSHCSITSFASK